MFEPRLLRNENLAIQIAVKDKSANLKGAIPLCAFNYLLN